MEPKQKKLANLYKSERMRFLHLRVPESFGGYHSLKSASLKPSRKVSESNFRMTSSSSCIGWMGLVEVRARLVITHPQSNFRETLHVSCEKTFNLSATDPLNYSIGGRTFSMDVLSSETSKGKDSVSFRGCSTKICSSCMQLPLTANHRFPEERRMENPTRDVKRGFIEITRHPTTSDSQMTTYDTTWMFSVVVIFPVFESMFFPSSKRPPKTQKTVWSPLVGITVCI